MSIHAKQSLLRIAARLSRPAAIAFRRSVWAVCLVTLTACSKDPLLPDGPSGKPSAATVNFSVEPLDDVGLDTRAGATGINNLWVLQALPDGKLIHKYYVNVKNTAQVQVPVVDTEEKCTFVFIANTGNNVLYKTCNTLEEVKTMKLRAENKDQRYVDVLTGTHSCLPLALSGATVSMKSAVAKLSVRLGVDTGDQSFALISIQVKNLPQVLCPGRFLGELDPGTDASKTYPSGSDVSTGDSYAMYMLPQGALSATPVDCGSVYLYENARGRGTATDPKKKTAATALRDQGAFATYVVISGYLRTAVNHIQYPCSFTIYLGSNLTNDYNILRGRHYVLTVTIKGVDQYDARISFAFNFDNEGEFYTTNPNNSVCRYDRYDSGSDLTWTQAMDACPIGWRLPTMKELEILLCMKSKVYGAANNFYDAHYWTETPSATNSNDAYSVHMGSGWVGVKNKNDKYRVRCVRDNNVMATRYPYAINNSSGRFIVFREGAAGLHDRLLEIVAPTWHTSPVYGNEKYPKKLEISTQIVPWASATSLNDLSNSDPCSNMLNKNGQTGWRVPRQCEMRMLVAFRDELGLISIVNNRVQKPHNYVREHRMITRTPEDGHASVDANGRWLVSQHKKNDATTGVFHCGTYVYADDGTRGGLSFKNAWAQVSPWQYQLVCVRSLN